MREVKTLCPYCGVGCGLLVKSDGKQIINVRGDPEHPANFGRLCAKGATVAQTVDVMSRARIAMIRDHRGRTLVPVSSEAAVQHVADRLNQIRTAHGPQAIAFYLSGQLTTESQYVFNKFAKGVLRTNHVDSNSRMCMSSAASGMSLSLGSDGPPTNYSDIELADTFFFIGSNAADCHPVTFTRVQRQIAKARARCIVVDPRRTPTAEAATIHLPIKPGTDLALLNGLMHILHRDGQLDESYIANNTQGFADVVKILPEYWPSRVAQICNIRVYDLIRAAEIIGEAKNLITFWTMGINQSVMGTFNNNAIINLHLALGQIGRPGCGPFSLTGQPNAMGGRDVGYMSHLLPGQRKIADPEHRAWMEQFWGIEADGVHPHAGHDMVAMFNALERGEIKAIWIAGTNPAASMPNLERVRRSLQAAALVIVQDAYRPTETTAFADVVFPAALNLEQAGTFCNSERRVTLMEQAVPPPGDAKPDWYWPCKVSHKMGFAEGMCFDDAAVIFDEFARSTAGRPNDQSGLSHELLRAQGAQQWPFPATGHAQARRYEDGHFPTSSGRAQFFARPYLPQEDSPTGRFPLLLTTGRVAGQWHTRTKSGLVEKLNQLDPAPYLQMHPDDATALKLIDGQRVDIVSRQGRAWSVLRITTEVKIGVVFMPMHWGDLWEKLASPNEVVIDTCDSISRQPALKYCAVFVEAHFGAVEGAESQFRTSSSRQSLRETR